VLINRHRDDLGSDIAERDASSEVSWIFHPDGVTPVEEKARQEIERLLDSGNYNYLVRTTAYPTRCAQVMRNRFA
jgi:hypothetical protein